MLQGLGGGGPGQRHHLSRCRENSISAGLAPARYFRISAEPSLPRLALSLRRVFAIGRMRQLVVGALLRSRPVGEPEVLARGVSMPDACVTSIGKRDTGAPVLHRTILRGSALASNVGASMPTLPFDRARQRTAPGSAEGVRCRVRSGAKHCLGFELGHSRQITRNRKFDHPSSARSGDWRRRARGSEPSEFRSRPVDLPGSGSWRREWDSDPRASFRFCKLQIPRCRRCH